MNDSGLFRAACWAGIISLDFTGFGPWMASQPVVAGPLFGWLMGQVRVGVIVGGIVQLIWMDISPVGVGIPFDTTAVTLLSIYWSTLQANCPVPKIVLALILAVPFGSLFCMIDSYARRLNTLLARRMESASDVHLIQALDLGIIVGLLWTWFRYAFLYAVVMALGEFGLWQLDQHVILPEWVNQGLILAACLFPIAGLGVVLELFLTEEPERRITSLRLFKPRS
jgi:mannose/fructose/N-acetylgalactosamine-specific phosphotransferase system component IIC